MSEHIITYPVFLDISKDTGEINYIIKASYKGTEYTAVGDSIEDAVQQLLEDIKGGE